MKRADITSATRFFELIVISSMRLLVYASIVGSRCVMAGTKQQCVQSFAAVIVLTLAVSLLGCAFADRPGEQAGATGAGVNAAVTLIAQQSGKCLDISGTSAIQSTCSGATSQQWTFNAVSGGSQIVSVFDPTRCVNVPNGSTTAGTLLAVTACSTGGVPGEVWTTAATGNDFTIVATQSHQCMDVYKQSLVDGAHIDQYTCNKQTNQMWAIQPATSQDASTDSASPPDASADAGNDAADAAGGAPVSLIGQQSGKCLDISGTSAIQSTCSGATSQQWTFNHVSGGSQIVSVFDPTRCVNVPGGSTAAGTLLAVTACSTGGVPGEVWTTAATGNDFTVVATQSHQCMDVYKQSLVDGAPVDQYTCNQQTNQMWAIQPVAPLQDASTDSAAPSDAGSDAADAGGGPPVSLVAQNSGKCLDISGTSAIQSTCTGATSQQWTFNPVSGGSQIVSVIDPTRCVNVPGGSATAGTLLAVTACSTGGVPGEVWTTAATGNDFTVLATHSRQCMDVYKQSTADGARIDQYTCNNQTNQMWAIQPIATSLDASADSAADATISADGSDDGSGGITDAAADATLGTGDAADGSGPAPVTLVSQNSGLCAGVWEGAVTQQTCTGASSQQWIFNPVAGGFQIVSALDPTTCMNLPGASTALGTAVAVTTCSTTGVPGEIWTSEPAANNLVNLVATHSQQCLDVYKRLMTAGAKIDQYTCNGQTNQQWAVTTAAPPDPVDGGQWSTLIDLPSIPVAAAMLPNGKILTWASWEPDDFGGSGDLPQTYTNMIDPQTLAVTSAIVTQTNHDMFCPGTAMLADGRILINGGGPVVANTSLYDALSGTWTADALMNETRWYSVSVTLPDGTVFTLGGNRKSGMSGTGERWTPDGGWQYVPGAVMSPIVTTDLTNRSQEHPRLFVAPNGEIFLPGPTPNMQWYNLADGGGITSAGTRGDDVFSQNDVTVMFDVGKLLKAGGNTNYDMADASTTPSSARAYVIDINDGGMPAVSKIAPLNHARAYATGVLLPDGQVLVVGGLDNGKAFTDVGAVLVPELFDPATNTWSDLPSMSVPRTYHSVALLMPDARVFVGGGGLCGKGCAANHSDAQIYSPPYLFQGTRPQITSAPGVASYGSSLSVTTAGSVTAFSWIRMSSVTHTINNDQRWLSASSLSTGGGAYSVAVPPSPNVAPPGYYMLFALNGRVPSVAQIVQIGP
jgi:hypothetical protein